MAGIALDFRHKRSIGAAPLIADERVRVIPEKLVTRAHHTGENIISKVLDLDTGLDGVPPEERGCVLKIKTSSLTIEVVVIDGIVRREVVKTLISYQRGRDASNRGVRSIEIDTWQRRDAADSIFCSKLVYPDVDKSCLRCQEIYISGEAGVCVLLVKGIG